METLINLLWTNIQMLDQAGNKWCCWICVLFYRSGKQISGQFGAQHYGLTSYRHGQISCWLVNKTCWDLHCWHKVILQSGWQDCFWAVLGCHFFLFISHFHFFLYLLTYIHRAMKYTAPELTCDCVTINHCVKISCSLILVIIGFYM